MKVWIIRGLDGTRQPAEIWAVVADPELIVEVFPRAVIADGERLLMGNRVVAKVELHEVYTGSPS